MSDLLSRLKAAAEFDREHFKEVIDKWTGYWMNQTQNSKEDYENYWRRAFGVDANMRHHLADLLEKDVRPLIDAMAEVIEIQEKAINNYIEMQEILGDEPSVAELDFKEARAAARERLKIYLGEK